MYKRIFSRYTPLSTTGQLEVHGQKRMRTWTKLHATVPQGQSWLLTSEPVDYKEGEIVVLTGMHAFLLVVVVCECVCIWVDILESWISTSIVC